MATLLISNPPFRERLLQHPSATRDESLKGFLLRLAEANGYRSWRWIAAMAERPMDKTGKVIDPKALAYVTNSSPELMARKIYRRMPGHTGRRLYFGSWVPSQALRFKITPFCPHCLLESGYFRASWDLSLLGVCHHHHIQLLDRCTHCNTPPDWRREKLLECSRCGADFRTQQTEKAYAGTIVLTRFLLEKVGMANSVPQMDQGYPQALRMASFGEAVSIVQLLAQFGAHRSIGGKALIFSQISPKQANILLEESHDALRNWPHGFHEYLDAVCGSRPGAPRIGLQEGFGPLYPALFRYNTARTYDFLREEFSSYVGERWGGCVISAKSYFARKMAKRRFVGTMAACKILGVSCENLRQLRARGDIHGLSGQDQDALGNVYDRQSILAYLKRAEDGLYLDEVLTLFDIHHPTFRQLIREGLIGPKPVVRLNRTLQPGYSKADAQALLAKLLGNARQISIPEACHVNWLQAVSILRPLRCDTGKLARLILQGDLKVAGLRPGKKGLSQALFLEADVRALLAQGASIIVQPDKRPVPRTNNRHMKAISAYNHSSLTSRAQG